MMALTEIAKLFNAPLPAADAAVIGVSTDTRTLREGELFVALQGPNFDGHAFVAQAVQKGAAAVLVNRNVGAACPQICVEDTSRALGRLAAYWRAKFDIPVIAITGSNGKTTVKQLAASVLSTQGSVLATKGNLNNEIGVPLTLLRLRREHQFAVVEMGANHGGEIAYLSALARPTVAIVTNAAPAHLQGFGTLDDVVRAKAEIFQGLSSDGTAVINHDDANYEKFVSAASAYRQLSFGLTPDADVYALPESIVEAAEDCHIRSKFTVRLGGESVQVTLPMMGRHNVSNALAVIAAAHACHLALPDIVSGLAAAQGERGRLQFKQAESGITVIDDTYNANPGSVNAAIEVLLQRPGPRVLVLGDMAELGDSAEASHREIGERAKRAGIQRIYAVGPYCSFTISAFGANGCHYDNRDSLAKALQGDIAEGTIAGGTILVKGSRSAKMETVVEAIVMPTISDGDGNDVRSPNGAVG